MSNAALDIAIGLVLMYLVLSLIATVINEIIASWMNWRATTLQAAITNILDNPTLRADFYDHGVIDAANDAVGGHTSYLSGSAFATALLASIDPTRPVPGFSDVEQAVKQMPDCNIRDILLSHVTAAQGDLNALRDGVAKYFDSTMDRVSGVYKRNLKWLSFWVAAVIVLVLNADTLRVGTALWRDASLRAQMVETADTVLKTIPPMATGKDGRGVRALAANGGSPPAVGGQMSPSQEQPSGNAIKAASDPIARLQELDGKLRPLPIGWSYRDIESHEGSTGELAWWAFTKLIGLALTALAISLGAPFWFDTLSKFMNVRGAGKKPKRSTATQ